MVATSINHTSRRAKYPTYSMKKMTNCPFCGGRLFAIYNGLQDRLFTTTQTFSCSECGSCHMGMLNPTVIGDTADFYPPNYLSDENETAKPSNGKRFDLEKWYRYNQYHFDFNLLFQAVGLSLATARSYLDIGCGSGERVLYASEMGCQDAQGIDKFDFAKTRPKENVRLIHGDILAYKPVHKIQIASLFHVLEHVENPREVLEHLQANVIGKQGYMIAQVPNYGSWERRLFGSRWFSWDVPRHLWQFNAQSLKKIMEDAGFTVVATYQKNAPLHPVTIVPSLFKELDVQRIWVNRRHGRLYKHSMVLLWAGLTIVTIPFTLLQNLFNRSAMLTIIVNNP